jgi:hypothetical protein
MDSNLSMTLNQLIVNSVDGSRENYSNFATASSPLFCLFDSEYASTPCNRPENG